MGGGLLQLVAMGAQDAYLSGNPQITFWKGMFKRHTNFAMEQFRVNLTGMPMWGQKQSATIGRHADLIYSTYLEVSLPVGLYNNDQRRLGYNLLRYVELEVGGQLIDRLYGEWLFLWDSLTSDVTKGLKLHGMVAAGITDPAASITTPASCNSTTGRPSKPTTLYIPLSFFYTRNAGTALPMIALQYHEVKINVLWNSAQLVAGDFTELSTAPNPSSAAIYVDYIYLDVEERRRMAQESHEYLIEQVQYNEDKGITSASQRVDLTFNHPVKELVWVVQPTAYTNCKLSTVARNNTNYGTRKVTAASLINTFGTPALNPATAVVRTFTVTPRYTLDSITNLKVGETVTFVLNGSTLAQNNTTMTVAETASGGGALSPAALTNFTAPISVVISSIDKTNNYIFGPVTTFTYTTGTANAQAALTAVPTLTLTGTAVTVQNNADTDRLTPFTYDKDAVFSQHLQFNGQDRLDKRFGDYYNKVQPFQHHTGSTASVYNNGSGGAISTAQPGVYCYSFALKPEEQQPSGTCNFSRIDTATIVMSIDGKVPIDRDGNEYDVRVYATNYNILRIMSGMAGLAYSN